MSIVTYPPTSVTITGVATETTLLAMNSSVTNILSKISLDVIIAPFYQAINSISTTPTAVGTVPVEKELQKLALKCNDGCTFIIDIDGTDKVETLPSGEVQFYDINAAAGAVISVRQVAPISNAGPLTINFFG